MKLLSGIQLQISHLQEVSLELFIYANNHEKRSKTCFNYLSGRTDIKKSIALCYDSSYEENRLNRQEEKVDYVVVQNYEYIKELLDKEFKIIEDKKINIAIDYSCMTKSWYYTIILYLQQKRTAFREVNCYFIYTPSKFGEPRLPKPNTEIGPLPGKYIVPTDKPKALIVGLGYEKNKAEGIIEHLDPKVFYLLYSKPALDNRFVEMVEENNVDLLNDHKNRILTYPLQDLIALEKELTSLYFLLREEFSIIIAPLGPKPFALIAMLLSIRYPDIDIWRVGSGTDINKYDREPLAADQFLMSKVHLVNE